MAFNWDGGAYVQDQWHLGDVTLNLGARYDKFNAYIPAQSVPDFELRQGFLDIPVGSRTRPDWNDWATRTGFAWDVFGTGRTAIKAYAGRFIAGEALSRTAQFNPIYSRQDIRNWTDLNADGKVINPDGTPQFNEIGKGSANFGSPDTVDKQDPDLKRDKNWTYELAVQHQLMRRVGLFFSYHRRTSSISRGPTTCATANFVDANNPGDWVPFTFVGPADPRFPNGGNEVITIVQPCARQDSSEQSQAGLPVNAQTISGLQRRRIGTNVRLPRNGFAMASLTSGKNHIHDCTVDNPNNLRFCDRTTPFRHILKLSGGMSLPYQIMVSSTFAVADTPGSGLFLAAPYFAANLRFTTATAGLPAGAIFRGNERHG